jgi:gliding motility-associated-like protein
LKRNAFILLALVHFLSYGQNSIDKWVFGRGQVMDFTTVPPSFSTTSWSSSSSLYSPYDGNSSSAYYDNLGNLLIYFLNGKYYDSSGVLIPGGQVPHYFNQGPTSGYNVRANTSCFFKSPLSDTVFHVYAYQDSTSPPTPAFNGHSSYSRLRLNTVTFDGAGWSITHLDDESGPVGTGFFNWFYPFSEDVSSKNILFAHLPSSSILTPYTINGQGFNLFSSPQFNQFDLQLDSLNSFRTLHYEPITNRFVGLTAYTITDRSKWRLWTWTNNGNLNFSRDSLAYPVVWPRAIGAAAYANFQVRLSSLSPDGRYFFGLATRHSIDSRCYIIRYDLLSADSLDFVAKAALIDLDTILNYPYVQDMRVGPDNNLYFSILESPMLNNSGNRRIARILYACEPDTSLISVQLNFATRPVLSVYQSFPTLSSNQTIPRPFQLITNCSDSVQFQFNLKNVPDSVWWDFGAPVLGAQNHSDVMHPWVRYPGGGTFYVSVELWLRGQLLRTMGDTIEVSPSPHVSLPNDTLLCRGQGLTLDARQGFAANYLWSTGSTDSTLVASQTGTYWVQVQNDCGTVRDTFNLVVIDPPHAQLRDTVLCDEWTHVLQVYADSANYLWSTGDTLPGIMPKTSNTYWVEITNPCGQIRDQAEIEVRRCMCNVWIPSAFTPNGDGVNESFEIKAECRDFEFTLDIFNRWGAHLYRQTDLNQPWDGRVNGQVVPNGIYTYRIQYWGREPEGLRWRDYSGTVQMLQ